ncbi:MAG: hypothetical protein EBR72_04295 [Bacteroidetes bacterium]|nr:hypothetical protein [Bacteroidota bacterium]
MPIKFISRLLILGLIVGILDIVYFYFTNEPDQVWYWSALLYYLLLGLIIGKRSHKAIANDSNSAFFMGIMSGTGIRMLFSIIFIAIYLIVSDIKSNLFIGYYLFLYLLFTIFEIYHLVHKLRTEKNTNKDNATS